MSLAHLQQQRNETELCRFTNCELCCFDNDFALLRRDASANLHFSPESFKRPVPCCVVLLMALPHPSMASSS